MIYGSNFCIVTLYPLFFNNLPRDAAVIPFPNPDTTPPVTNMYFLSGALPIILTAFVDTLSLIVLFILL